MANELDLIGSIDVGSISTIFLWAGALILIVAVLAGGFIWYYFNFLRYNIPVVMIVKHQGGRITKTDKGWMQKDGKTGRSVFHLKKEKIKMYKIDLNQHMMGNVLHLYKFGTFLYSVIKFKESIVGGEKTAEAVATLGEDMEWIRIQTARELQKRRNAGDWLKEHAMVLVGLGFIIIIIIIWWMSLDSINGGLSDNAAAFSQAAQTIKELCGPQQIQGVPPG